MVDTCLNSFNSRSTLTVGGQSFEIFRLDELERAGVGAISRLPFAIKILLENMLRHENGPSVQKGDIEALARWSPAGNPDKEMAFTPARVLMQDRTGVPALVGRHAGCDSAHGWRSEIDAPDEVAYYRHGGILPYVLRQLMKT
jgi:aconitase A